MEVRSSVTTVADWWRRNAVAATADELSLLAEVGATPFRIARLVQRLHASPGALCSARALDWRALAASFADLRRRLGPAIDAAFGRPKAIVVVSAHSLTREPAVLASPRLAAVHDFSGFDPALYELRYDAPAREWTDALPLGALLAMAAYPAWLLMVASRP